MYLLAKKLPHTLVSDQNDEFKKLLKDTKAEEIVRFAEAVKSADSTIDGKVCAKGGASNNAAASWKCQQSGGSDGKKLSEIYTQADVRNEAKGGAWPTGKANAASSDDLATGLLNEISTTEKRTVAGLLSKTVTGAEVVEIRAVHAARE